MFDTFIFMFKYFSFKKTNQVDCQVLEFKLDNNERCGLGEKERFNFCVQCVKCRTVHSSMVRASRSWCISLSSVSWDFLSNSIWL